MLITLNVTGIKDNLQHIAGLLIGSVSKRQFTKDERGTKWFSTVAVTLAQHGIYQWLPYKMLIVKKLGLVLGESLGFKLYSNHSKQTEIRHAKLQAQHSRTCSN